MIIPDKTKKTVRIAVRIEEGKVVQFDGTPLPKIQDGKIGDLILPAMDILDEVERKELEWESFVSLLPEGALVLVGLSPEMMKRDDRDKLRAPSDLKVPAGYWFADVQLLETLELRLRGYKDACLEPCKCWIPVLKKKAKSLNHALTLLSTEFETERISHSGNVFTRVFFRTRNGWRPLNEARGKIELS